MTHLIILMTLAWLVLYGPSKLRKKKDESPDLTTTISGQPIKAKDANTFIMKLHGGPADGHVEKIVEPERPLFFVATYPPEIDEATGMVPEENIVGHMYGKMYIRPNYAYYRYVLEDEYIYVRDLAEKEVQNIAITGEQPLVKPEGSNDEEDE